MKEQIYNLVIRGQLAEAVNLLPGNEGILLAARLNNLDRSVRMGTISHDSATMQRNQITHAILSFAGIDDSFSVRVKAVAQPATETPEAILQAIIIQNKRRREPIANEAREILSRLQAYRNEKALSSAFDPAGSRFRAIEHDITDLKEKLNDAKDDDIEAIVDRVKKLLSDTVPSYDQLNEAYRLASGRGMKSEYIDRTLNSRPEDPDARITIAEQIESFIATIHVV